MNLMLYMAEHSMEIVNIMAVRILLPPIINPSQEEVEFVKIEKATIHTPIVRLISLNRSI